LLASLVGLADALHKNRAPSGKTSQRSPTRDVFPPSRYASSPIDVPPHSHLLEGAAEKAVTIFGSADVSWSPSPYPPPSTTRKTARISASSLRARYSSSRSSPRSSPLVTNFPATAMHAIAFGIPFTTTRPQTLSFLSQLVTALLVSTQTPSPLFVLPTSLTRRDREPMTATLPRRRRTAL
ncbi:hypothetical protein JCM5296_006998, partial [Sporobolomyces johnsonii]